MEAKKDDRPLSGDLALERPWKTHNLWFAWVPAGSVLPLAMAVQKRAEERRRAALARLSFIEDITKSGQDSLGDSLTMELKTLEVALVLPSIPIDTSHSCLVSLGFILGSIFMICRGLQVLMLL
jgi:hypothetical protein